MGGGGQGAYIHSYNMYIHSVYSYILHKKYREETKQEINVELPRICDNICNIEYSYMQFILYYLYKFV
jgi:hypothetical protein